MPIGQGADYYNGTNKEEDERIKLAEEVQEWWESLDDNYKFELIEVYYPDKAHLMDVDEMWEGLDWQDRLDIYKRENRHEDN